MAKRLTIKTVSHATIKFRIPSNVVGILLKDNEPDEAAVGLALGLPHPSSTTLSITGMLSSIVERVADVDACAANFDSSWTGVNRGFVMMFFGAIGDATSSTSDPDSADASLPFLCFNKIRE